MRKLFILFLLLLGLAFPICADQVPGQVIVKFKPGVIKLPKGMSAAAVSAAGIKASSVNALNAKHGVVRLKQLYAKVLEIKPEWTELADDYILEFPAGQLPEEVAKEYRQDPNVELAQPNSLVHAFVTNPNDPKFQNGDQWGLNKINAPLAWDRSTGSTSVLIAVLDTGANYNHEDLQGQLDLANAWDFVNNDADPMDDHTGVHGTTVTGVIGAVTDNSKGVAGINWQTKVLPVKVLDNLGDGQMSDILSGLAWARAKGARVINMSFGQYFDDLALKQACLDAYNDDIVLIGAAGNGNTDELTYPACYPTVLAVGATDQSDARSIWSGTDPHTGRTQASNYGSWVDVCAPGTTIWSTYMNVNEYNPSSGTSLASPFVTGLAGLVRTVNPAFTNQQVMDKITREADVVATDQPIGKRINAYLAIAGVVARISSPTADSFVQGQLAVTGSAAGWDFSGYRLDALRGSLEVATIEASSATVESDRLGSWDTGLFNGEHFLRLRVFSTGANTEEVTVRIFIDNLTPEATISYPSSGTALAGRVTVLGTVRDQYLDHYDLEYGVGSSPVTWQNIITSFSTVEAGRLATWETAGLNGQYTIRLTVTDKIGAATSRSALVTLQNGDNNDKRVVPQAGFPLTYAVPSPFNRRTTPQITLNYNLSSNFDTRIYLFDLSGNLLWSRAFIAGENGAKSGANDPAWNGADLGGAAVPNGVYLYQIVADQRVLAKGRIAVLN